MSAKETSASKFVSTKSSFDKLDDLPKAGQHIATYDEVMTALARLHKLVLKQAKNYGGKNSKLFPAQVVETSLLKSVADDWNDAYEDVVYHIDALSESLSPEEMGHLAAVLEGTALILKNA